MSLLTNTFTVIFHLRKINAHNEKLPVYARITINRKRIELSVKQMMNPNDWNENAGLAKPNTEEYIRFNNYLEQLKSTYFASSEPPNASMRSIIQRIWRRLIFIISFTGCNTRQRSMKG